ncbi:MAG: bile acid:sodium symporter [Spirochaetaceae bacterium]|jgi:ACR3 family arsenite efflux pump ArsB|nr:bile acid:sodium symporter [Spirochaetaceae bacterium]
MSLFSKLQPVFIIFSAFAGVFLGKISVNMGQKAGGLIEPFLVLMLFFVFLGVDIKKITKSFTNLKFSISALFINFLWTPVFSFLLADVFFHGHTSLQTGFIMLMVTPCTDWYLIFTGLANGNVTLGSSILPLNLTLQIILLPVFLFIFMGQKISFGAGIAVQSILFVLVIPLVSACIAKFVIKKAGFNFSKITKRNDDIQFVLLCFAVAAMFASQGAVLLANLAVFIKLLPPLIIFFAVNFFLSLLAGQKLKLPFGDTISLIFTTSARNSPVSLAIAIIVFPSDPIVSLVLVMGPLIELPVLAINASLLGRFSLRRTAD